MLVLLLWSNSYIFKISITEVSNVLSSLTIFFNSFNFTLRQDLTIQLSLALNLPCILVWLCTHLLLVTISHVLRSHAWHTMYSTFIISFAFKSSESNHSRHEFNVKIHTHTYTKLMVFLSIKFFISLNIFTPLSPPKCILLSKSYDHCPRKLSSGYLHSLHLTVYCCAFRVPHSATFICNHLYSYFLSIKWNPCMADIFLQKCHICKNLKTALWSKHSRFQYQTVWNIN